MREKTALVVFVFLLLVGFALCAAYISGLTRGLNVAASTIDEAAGELDGYTAIVFEGVPRASGVAHDAATQPPSSAAKQPSADVTAPGTPSSDAPDALPARSGWEAFMDAMRGKATKDDVGTAGATKGDAGTTGASKDDDAAADSEADVAGQAATDDGAVDVVQDDAESANADEGDDVPPTIQEVREAFLDKAASSFVLDLSDPAVYDQRTVVVSSEHRFGILRIQPGCDPATLAERVAEYERAGVDIVVAVTDSLASVASACEKAQAALAAASAQASSADASAQGAGSEGSGNAAAGGSSDAPKPAERPAASGSAGNDSASTDGSPVDEEGTELAAFSLSDLDIVVSLADEGLSEDGDFFRGTFFVQAPASPAVGAVVVSPSKTFVSRVFS